MHTQLPLAAWFMQSRTIFVFVFGGLSPRFLLISFKKLYSYVYKQWDSCFDSAYVVLRLFQMVYILLFCMLLLPFKCYVCVLWDCIFLPGMCVCCEIVFFCQVYSVEKVLTAVVPINVLSADIYISTLQLNVCYGRCIYRRRYKQLL